MRGRSVAAAVTALALLMGVSLGVPVSASTPVWQPTLPLTSEVRVALSALPDGTVVVSSGQATARSTDGGRTWELLPDPPEAPRGYPRFATRDLGWSNGLSSMYLTVDGGQTWRPSAPLPSDGGRPSVTATAVVEATETVYVAGDAYGPEQLGCNVPTGVVWSRHRTDGAWKRFDLGVGIQGYQIRPLDRDRAVLLAHHLEPTDEGVNVCAVPDLTSVWTTGDAGTTWQLVRECPSTCTAAAMPRAGSIVIGYNDGRTSRSDDGGRTWSDGPALVEPELAGSPVGDGFFVQSFSFVEGRVGYASTKGGGTWRTSDAGRSWERELWPDRAYPGLGAGEVDAIDADQAVIAGFQSVAIRTQI